MHEHQTRTFYDAVADEYLARYDDELARRPLDRAMLAAFADLVRADPRPVADLGCGPGFVAAHLHGLGLPSVFGVDLSPRMVELARTTHPELRFEVGSMTSLDLPDAALGGVVAWYSVIHTPARQLPRVCHEFGRVLGPGGHLLVAFQVGDEPRHVAEPFGLPVSLDFHRNQPDRVADLLAKAGLAVTARLVREPDTTGPHPEQTPQAFLLARKPR